MTLPPDLRPETRVALDAVNTALMIARRRTGADDVTEKGERDLVTGADIAVEDAVLSSLFVIQYELDGDRGTTGPSRMRRLRAVADHVARIGAHCRSPNIRSRAKPPSG